MSTSQQKVLSEKKMLDLLVLKFLILIGANKLFWSCVVLVGRIFKYFYVHSVLILSAWAKNSPFVLQFQFDLCTPSEHEVMGKVSFHAKV